MKVQYLQRWLQYVSPEAGCLLSIEAYNFVQKQKSLWTCC